MWKERKQTKTGRNLIASVIRGYQLSSRSLLLGLATGRPWIGLCTESKPSVYPCVKPHFALTTMNECE